jgi:hypothetical protein
MFCKNCGGGINEAENFCANCGAKVTSAAPDAAGSLHQKRQNPPNPGGHRGAEGAFPENPPSPISGIRVNNTLAWAVAVVPLAGTAAELLLWGETNYMLFWAYWIINSLICYIDDKALRKAGVDTSNFQSWIFLVPVYLYKRAKHLNHSKAYFIANAVSFIIAACIS